MVNQGQAKCVSVEQICHKQILQQIPYKHQNFQVPLHLWLHTRTSKL